jgi:hypothetical protein
MRGQSRFESVAFNQLFSVLRGGSGDPLSLISSSAEFDSRLRNQAVPAAEKWPQFREMV